MSAQQLPYRKILASHALDIVWLQSDGNYTYVHFKNGNRQLVCKTICLFERQLCPHLFVRVSRSAVVNLDCVQTLQSEQFALLLRSGERVAVSRRRFKLLCDRWNLLH